MSREAIEAAVDAARAQLGLLPLSQEGSERAEELKKTRRIKSGTPMPCPWKRENGDSAKGESGG